MTTSGGNNQLCIRTGNARRIFRLPSSVSTKVMIIDHDDVKDDGLDGSCDDDDHHHNDHDDDDAGMTTQQCPTSVNTTTVLLTMPYVSQVASQMLSS